MGIVDSRKSVKSKVISQPQASGNIPASMVHLSQLDRWQDLFGFAVEDNGLPVVTPMTVSTIPAAKACINAIANGICQMPFVIKKGNDIVDDHPLASVLRGLPDGRTPMPTFMAGLVKDLLIYGDALALIERKVNGGINALYRIPPRSVWVQWVEGRGVVYQVSRRDASPKEFSSADILHIPFLDIDLRTFRGSSPISEGSDAFRLARAAGDFAGRFFASSGNMAGVVEYDDALPPDAAETLRDGIARQHGERGKEGKTLILDRGGKYKGVTPSAEAAQLLEARRFQVEEIARAYCVPLHIIQHVDKASSWGAGIEGQGMDFVRYTLGGHVARIESEINAKIMAPMEDGARVDLDMSVLLRGDTKSRYEGHARALGGNNLPGWKTPNEIRKDEGLPPMPDGDLVYSPPVDGQKHSQMELNG